MAAAAAAALVLGLAFAGSPARAQSNGIYEGMRSPALIVGGRTVTCSSAGRPVVWIAAYRLNDLGLTIPTASGTVIEYNPALLGRMPTPLKLFWLGHECGHAYLQTRDESRADCWSAYNGVRLGWFNLADVDELAAVLQSSPGDAGHPPGPVRVANVRTCVVAASKTPPASAQ